MYPRVLNLSLHSLQYLVGTQGENWADCPGLGDNSWELVTLGKQTKEELSICQVCFSLINYLNPKICWIFWVWDLCGEKRDPICKLLVFAFQVWGFMLFTLLILSLHLAKIPTNLLFYQLPFLQASKWRYGTKNVHG